MSSFAHGQITFDSIKVDKLLLTLPKQEKPVRIDTNIIRAIEAVDKNYRIIADTLYSYKSLKHTIFQTIYIQTNDNVLIDPLYFGDNIRTYNIVFNNKSLNIKVDSIAKHLAKNERIKFISYLKNNFDNFSEMEQELNPQPVRIRYIKFPDSRMVQVGIDIYGKHFLWTVDREKNWDVIKVEDLWVY